MMVGWGGVRGWDSGRGHGMGQWKGIRSPHASILGPAHTMARGAPQLDLLFPTATHPHQQRGGGRACTPSA